MNGTRMRTFGGHLAAITVGVLVAVTVLSGTAYAPPQTKPVNIADLQEPNNVADVSADGALEVEGTVTGQVDVGNLPAVQEVTSEDDPGRVAFTQRRSVTGTSPLEVTFDVPAIKRLVITYVSGSVILPDGADAGYVRFDGEAHHYFVPTFTSMDPTLGQPLFVFSEDTQIYVDDDFSAFVAYHGGITGALRLFDMSVSGYLIDCSRTAPLCN